MCKLVSKGDKLYSVFYNYCPRCHTGTFWPENNPYKNILVNNGGDIGSCKNCMLKYELEVGFWYGAMYISYALSVFNSILVWIITSSFFEGISILSEILVISFMLLLFSPVVYFFSRLIWINIFVDYDIGLD